MTFRDNGWMSDGIIYAILMAATFPSPPSPSMSFSTCILVLWNPLFFIQVHSTHSEVARLYAHNIRNAPTTVRQLIQACSSHTLY
jgi:hypothetical protein